MRAMSDESAVEQTTIVVIGGGTLSPRALDLARPLCEGGCTVVAADSGLDHAIEAALEPSVLVGDLDSLSAAGRMWAYAHGTLIEEFPADKDLTDTELAIARVVATSDNVHLLVLGGIDPTDARLDHVLGTLAALGDASLAGLRSIRAVIGTTEFQVVHAGHVAELSIDAGQTFSLLALHGVAEEVTLSGARWPLTSATLHATKARGVSNIADGTVSLSVGIGTVTVVIP